MRKACNTVPEGRLGINVIPVGRQVPVDGLTGCVIGSKVHLQTLTDETNRIEAQRPQRHKEEEQQGYCRDTTAERGRLRRGGFRISCHRHSFTLGQQALPYVQRLQHIHNGHIGGPEAA